MKRLSISLRLTAWYAGISAIGLTVFGVLMGFVLANSMISWKDRTLQMRVACTEAVLTSAAHADQLTLNQRLEAVVAILPEGEWIQIVGADGRRRFPVDRLPAAVAEPAHCTKALYRDQMVGGKRFRVLCHPVQYQNESASLLALSPLSEDRILLGNFSSGLYRMVPILLVVSGIGGYILSRRALAPVDLVIAEARTITALDLSRRLTVSTADDQLRRLAVEWNNLLSRIESAMARFQQFTADASHELRSPIAFIRLTAEYHLGASNLDDELRDGFNAILQESRMATEMLKGLLLLARLDAEQANQQAEPVDISAIVSDLAVHFEPSLQKRQQELRVANLPRNRLLVRVNAGHLRGALLAVLDNAIKYTPAGGTIRVDFAKVDSLHVRITDTGVGIAAHHLVRIFDRFFRVDEARTTVAEGVGLGLSIAKRLMEQAGCSISVVSQLGEGTSMILEFPKALLLDDDCSENASC